MTIKRRPQKTPPLSPSEAGATQAAQTKERAVKTTTWNTETIQTGEAPERRTQQRHDRRNNYRRVEDKQLVSKAHEEANAIREKAYEDGFQEGLNNAKAELNSLYERLGVILAGRDEALLSVSDDIAGLAVEVASRIIKTEVSCDDTLVMSLVHDTIRKAGQNAKSVLIKLHTTDVKTVQDILKDEPLPGIKAEVVVISDPAVDKGSCIIETNSGLIDASFTTQLRILHKLLGHQPASDEATL